MVKGYKQKLGIDYFEIFALVARFDTVYMIIFLTIQNNKRIYQMDIKSTFLNGVLNKEAYVELVAVYIRRGQKNKVYRLKRAFIWIETSPESMVYLN